MELQRRLFAICDELLVHMGIDQQHRLAILRDPEGEFVELEGHGDLIAPVGVVEEQEPGVGSRILPQNVQQSRPMSAADVVEMTHDRIRFARELLQKRLQLIRAEGKDPAIFDIMKTHIIPFDDQFKPQVQHIEEYIVFEGKIFNSECVIPIHKIKDNEFLYGFKLFCGKMNLSNITLTINGNKFDSYKLDVYEQNIEFYFKDYKRPLYGKFYETASIMIDNIPPNIHEITLVGKKVVVDPMVMDIYNHKIGFMRANSHVSFRMKKIIGFISTNAIIIERYGIYSPSLPITAVVDEINGIKVKYMDRDNDKIIWFSGNRPINTLQVKLTRKSDDPIYFIGEIVNYVLFMDNRIIQRYTEEIEPIDI
jgi:hypothetical protein